MGEEHDVYPTINPHKHWDLVCADCAEKYEIYEHAGKAIVRKRDAVKHRNMLAEYAAARRKAHELAAPKYEQRGVDFLLSRPSKKVMHQILGVGMCSYGTFLKRASRDWLEAEAKDKFRRNLSACLKRLGVQDAEVMATDEAATKLEKDGDAFWNRIEKRFLL